MLLLLLLLLLRHVAAGRIEMEGDKKTFAAAFLD
jgi:hypothetical protein